MEDQRSIELDGQWRLGTPGAATELFHRYAKRLVSLVQSRLPAKLAQRVDAEDVVHSAYRSFFSAATDGRYDCIHGSDLWQLLVTITLHKLFREMKRHSAQKRSIDREQTFGNEDNLLRLCPTAATPGPSPVEAVVLLEELEDFQRQLKPPHRRILELRLQGHNVGEIAQQMACTERTVWRVLELLQLQLRQRLGPPAAS
jgi:RNA polymerase sigma factor (sigma-70 family)